MQKHLRDTGLAPLRYWNRTLSRGEILKEQDATPCLSIEEVVRNCDIIFISVSDDSALNTVISSILQSGPLTSKIIVDTTTIHPSTTSSVSLQIHKHNATYIAAPVFGATPTARAGELLVAIAGPPQALQTVSPLFKAAIARAVMDLGPDPSTATLLKTTGNFITAGLMYMLSEAHTLAAKTGLPAQALEELLELNFGAYVHGVSARLTSGAYFPAEGQPPRSGLELGMKDVGHGVGLARENGMRLEIGELYLDAAREAKGYAGEGRKCDSSSVFGIVRQRAGLDFETESVKERDDKAKARQLRDKSQ
ncbi:hypothetical protein J1614_009388 [Plenodomus biglobosus]|nr:hypothetical protein J1614_009388 [Plenodomus biglobosus]